MLEILSFCDRDNSNKHNSANVSGDKNNNNNNNNWRSFLGSLFFVEYAKTLSVKSPTRSRSCPRI